MVIPKIGFACKYIDRPEQVNGIKSNDDCKKYNTGTTTVAWLNRQSVASAEDKLWALMKQNIYAVKKLVEKVGSLNENCRMVRISSDILPCYTHDNWSHFWQQADVIRYAEKAFAEVGDIARRDNVRLSMHPGQFCCIASDSDDVISRSIDELEYHANIAKWLGFGKSKLDFKINVHLSGRRGVDHFDSTWNQLSPELRNCLTLENDEYQQGLDELLVLKDKVGIVLDIHHHFIKDNEYITSTDPRIAQVIDSWQGQRPTIHYSQSRDEYINQFSNTMPPMEQLLLTAKKSKLRAHSDFFTNTAINDWALTHLAWSDIMCEVKSKNIGSQSLYDQWIASK